MFNISVSQSGRLGSDPIVSEPSSWCSWFNGSTVGIRMPRSGCGKAPGLPRPLLSSVHHNSLVTISSDALRVGLPDFDNCPAPAASVTVSIFFFLPVNWIK